MISRRDTLWLAITAAGAVVAKAALLLTSQSAVDADEAVLGLMALHIKQGVSHPLFFYGQGYDAGSGLVAHAAALIFLIAGVSAIALKVTGLLVWLSTAAMGSTVAGRLLGWRAAGLTAALMLWAPTSVEWALKARGGHMLAGTLALLTIGLALTDSKFSNSVSRRTSWRDAALGVCGAVTVWTHPSTAPVVAAVLLFVAVEWIVQRQFIRLPVLFAAAGALSLIPLGVLRASASTWSWQAFAGSGAQRDPTLLFSFILPDVFTPGLDGSIPPTRSWITAVGCLWLAAAAAACVAAFIALHRSAIPDHLRRPTRLLLAATCAAPLALLIVDRQYARPRVLLMLYPLGCIAIACAAEMWMQKRPPVWPSALVVALLLAGVAVHWASLGPPMIHGAGEQERVIPAAVVDSMVADLDHHGVRCVFSESPMLQWNLMFSSHERIAARWLLAEDRWQPYVERVNKAFAAGETCALLIRDIDQQSVAKLRGHLTGPPDRLAAFEGGYALLYDPPRKLIMNRFKRNGGWE
jgi:hypothetical protein